MNKTLTLLFGLVLLMTMGCQTASKSKINQTIKPNIIEGELYFKLISFDSFYGVPDSLSKKFELSLEDFSNRETNTNEYQEIIDHFDLLKENNLINKPCFNFKLKSDKVVTVYLSEKQYAKVKNFNRSDLIDERKKVDISLTGRFVNDGIIDCQEILYVKKDFGKTYWRK